MTQQIPKYHSKYRGNFCVALDNTGPASIFVLGSMYLRLYKVASELVLVSYWIALDCICLYRPVNIFF